ncbi:MAG: adenylosuccinate synthase [Atribacterota bacterium]|nr:adenylosuccinate synthase [Atribacterota bacterium]MDD4895983.1 adenylosuccinate synthase [Atribacterota bacterium]MDD5638062.1 adenylosuccinate synthase [Atribacterota bacterium]
MSTLIIVGTQWGDEGKGKITDLLSENYDIIARYQGGSNAGHTVVLDKDIFIFHLLPSGILHEDKICLIGNGVVLDPEVLFQEIENLQQHDIDIAKRLFIDYKAHIILPYHKIIDEAIEENTESRKIGTTKRGIGPAYVDKLSRTGLRVCDLIHSESLTGKLDFILKQKSDYLLKYFGIKLSKKLIESIKEKYIQYGKLLEPFVIDGSLFLDEQIQKNKNIIFEGAQGTMLDVDHGTYPYVTSSNPVAGNACIGCGISPIYVDKVIGIAKAYTTRVGEGPFPTELKGSLEQKIREYGHEYGATTGRPRRCGWFDAVVVKYANRINGIKEIVLTKLDVLSSFKKIKICREYQIKDESYFYFPGNSELIPFIKPVYEEVDGWEKDISNISNYQNLPEKAKEYIRKIEQVTESTISIISVGPKRTQTIFR